MIVKEPGDDQQDEVLQRMRRADPARACPPPEPQAEDLVATAISTAATLGPTAQARRWAPALAAAVAVATLGGGAYAALRGGDSPPDAPHPTTATLALPGNNSGPSMQSCIPFEVKHLREMPTALSGTATEIGADHVTIEVDHWYQGGDADLVELAIIDEGTVMLDEFAFIEGERYLITATDGTVNGCGFSGPWTEDLAEAYDEAFADNPPS